MCVALSLPAGPAKTGQLSTEVVTGVAIKKGESDPPILPDSEYPAWLFQLMKPESSVAELERMYKAEGLELPQVGWALVSVC
jgi:large subunit ribosomal protein L54